MPDKHPLEQWWQIEAEKSLLTRMSVGGYPPPIVVEAWDKAIEAAVEAVETYGVCSGDLDVLRKLRYRR